MEPVYVDDDSNESENEYILTQLANHRITYSENPDQRRADDFDVTLVLSHISPMGGGSVQEKKTLALKYFVIMTSKRELYPMKGQWTNVGKFRTVTTSNQVRADLENSLNPLLTVYQCFQDGSRGSKCSTPRATPEIRCTSRRTSLQEKGVEEGMARESSFYDIALIEEEETSLKSHILGRMRH